MLICAPPRFPKPIRMSDFLQLLFPFSLKFTLCNCGFPFSIFQGKSGARLGNWPPRSGTFRIACESLCDSLFWWGTSCQLDLGTKKTLRYGFFIFFSHKKMISLPVRHFRHVQDTLWLWLTVCHGKSHFLIGKPSISMGHLYHGYVTVMTRWYFEMMSSPLPELLSPTWSALGVPPPRHGCRDGSGTH